MMGKAVAWARAHWLIVLMCVVIVAAPVGFYIGANIWNTKIQTARETEAKAHWATLQGAEVTYSLAPSLPGQTAVEVTRAPHEMLTNHFAQMRAHQAAQIQAVSEAAIELNKAGHGVLVEGLFPAPPAQTAQLMRLEMQERIQGAGDEPSAIEELIAQSVNGGEPPDADEAAELLGEFQVMEIERHEAATGSREMSEEEAAELAEALKKRRIGEYQRRADELGVYAGPDSIPAGFKINVGGQAPELVTSFIWQWDYWIMQDLLRAIRKANTQADGSLASVPDAAVKRIVSIEIPLPAGLYEDGPQMPDVSGSGPLIARDPAVSLTGRASHDGNELYDVRPVTVSLIVESARLPEVIEAISSTNFMSVIDMDVQSINPWEHLQLGYFYGNEHVVKVDFVIETVWLRSWVAPLMPENMRNILGIEIEVEPEGDA